MSLARLNDFFNACVVLGNARLHQPVVSGKQHRRHNKMTEVLLEAGDHEED